MKKSDLITVSIFALFIALVLAIAGIMLNLLVYSVLGLAAVAIVWFIYRDLVSKAKK